MDLVKTFLVILCVSMVPTTARDFHFKKIPLTQALVIKVKRTSPPMALVEDMQIKNENEAAGVEKVLEPLVSDQNIRILPGIKISQRSMERVITPSVQESFVDHRVAEMEPNRKIEAAPQEPENETLKSIQRFFSQAAVPEIPGRETVSVEAKEIMKSNSPSNLVVHTVTQKQPGKNQTQNGATSATTDTQDSSILITGIVQLQNVGFTAGQRLSLYRDMNGQKIEEGMINLSSGDFSIRAAEAKGFLRAEVKNSSGRVEASGEIYLNAQTVKYRKLAGLKIDIAQESSASFHGNASTAYASDSSEDPVLGARIKYSTSAPAVGTNKIGRFEVHGIHPKSSVVITAEKKGFWNSLVLTSTQKRSAVTMYPNSMVDALQQVIAKEFGLRVSDIQNGGIVWGRVLSGRKPIEGAVVESASTQGIGPIYFNSLHLPDTKLQTTSSNGLFVYLNVPTGTQSIRAHVKGRYLPSRILPVEDRHVTPIEITTAPKAVGVIQSYDAFSKESVQTAVRFAASPKNVQTNMGGVVKVNVAQTEEPLFLEAEGSGEYLPIRMSFDRRDRTYNLLQVRDSWLNSLKINRAPNTGLVIGFIDGKRFDVFLDVNGKPHNEIYYFTASGEITPMPVAGGGFVIANIPHGIRTVSIAAEGTDSIFHQVVSIDDEYIAVIAQKF